MRSDGKSGRDEQRYDGGGKAVDIIQFQTTARAQDLGKMPGVSRIKMQWEIRGVVSRENVQCAVLENLHLVTGRVNDSGDLSFVRFETHAIFFISMIRRRVCSPPSPQ